MLLHFQLNKSVYQGNNVKLKYFQDLNFYYYLFRNIKKTCEKNKC